MRFPDNWTKSMTAEDFDWGKLPEDLDIQEMKTRLQRVQQCDRHSIVNTIMAIAFLVAQDETICTPHILFEYMQHCIMQFRKTIFG